MMVMTMIVVNIIAVYVASDADVALCQVRSTEVSVNQVEPFHLRFKRFLSKLHIVCMLSTCVDCR